VRGIQRDSFSIAQLIERVPSVYHQINARAPSIETIAIWEMNLWEFQGVTTQGLSRGWRQYRAERALIAPDIGAPGAAVDGSLS